RAGRKRAGARVRPAGHFFGMSAGHSSTRVPGTFSTSTCPLRSSTGPRGASSRSVRTRLSFATARYLSPARTCSAQRRKKRTAKTASARNARIATRNASCGVSRYASPTRGSPGRKRPGRAALAKETHLADTVAKLERREDPADQRVHRQREHEVEEKGKRKAVRD